MATSTVVGILALAVAGLEVAVAARLRVAARRRGGGLVVGAVGTAVCAVLLVRHGHPALYVVAATSQVLALLSLVLLLRPSRPGTPGT